MIFLLIYVVCVRVCKVQEGKRIIGYIPNLANLEPDRIINIWFMRIVVGYTFLNELYLNAFPWTQVRTISSHSYSLQIVVVSHYVSMSRACVLSFNPRVYIAICGDKTKLSSSPAVGLDSELVDGHLIKWYPALWQARQTYRIVYVKWPGTNWATRHF